MVVVKPGGLRGSMFIGGYMPWWVISSGLEKRREYLKTLEDSLLRGVCK